MKFALVTVPVVASYSPTVVPPLLLTKSGAHSPRRASPWRMQSILPVKLALKGGSRGGVVFAHHRGRRVGGWLQKACCLTM